MNLLIAVKSCHKHRLAGYNQAIRDAWGKAVEEPAKLLFFHGNGDTTGMVDDEVALDVGDDYDSLPQKTREILKFFLMIYYTADYIFLCDTDTYIKPAKLLACIYRKYDIAGRYGCICKIGKTFDMRDDRGGLVMGAHPWPSGGVGYFLSRKAAEIVVTTPITHWAEDFHVGQATGPYIQRGELSAVDLPNFECEAAWHFQRREYKNEVYDLKFRWQDKMYRMHQCS